MQMFLSIPGSPDGHLGNSGRQVGAAPQTSRPLTYANVVTVRQRMRRSASPEQHRHREHHAAVTRRHSAGAATLQDLWCARRAENYVAISIACPTHHI